MERLYGKPLLNQEDIHKRVRDLGHQITADYEGKDLLMIGILKGAYNFFSDLTRAVMLPVRVDFVIATSYGMATATSGAVRIISDLTEDIAGKDVLMVDDIIDSGVTTDFMKKHLLSKRPRSLKTCVLLDKKREEKGGYRGGLCGFSIPNKYVVGYGLDYQNKYRNLPYIAVLDVNDAQT